MELFKHYFLFSPLWISAVDLLSMISAPIVKITDSHKKLFELYRIGPKISFDFFFPFSRVSEKRESKATNLSPIEKNSELRFLSERERERERRRAKG